MKKLPLILITAAVLFGAESKTFKGVITDTMCGKDHAHMKLNPIADCVKQCVKAGKDKYALLTPDGKLYKLSDQTAPEPFAAKEVKVTGTLYEKTGIIKVEKIEKAK
ncbi:MAG: DUF5818 domain-containing protein [Bryobacteraceae bacterium]